MFKLLTQLTDTTVLSVVGSVGVYGFCWSLGCREQVSLFFSTLMFIHVVGCSLLGLVIERTRE